MKKNIERWKLLEDEFVFDIMNNGLKLKFIDINKAQSNLVTNITERSFNKARSIVIEECITEFINLGLVSEIDSNRKIFPNHVFVVFSELRTKNRLILDMKDLNKNIVSEKFSMWNIEKLIPFISMASFAGVIDISKAYCHIPMHQSTKDYLAFSFNGRKFSYNCMPFGLKTAPFYFTRVLKPVLGYLRKMFGIQIFAYLDDLLILGNTREQTTIDLATTKNFLQFLGFKLNPKSTEVPLDLFTYLGVQFDLKTKQCSIQMKTLRKCKIRYLNY